MKRTAFILALVVVGVVAALIFAGINSISRQFKPLAGAFLKECAKENVDAAYDMLSTGAKKSITREELRAGSVPMFRVLGEFREIGFMSGFNRAVGTDQSTCDIVVTAGFANGDVSAQFWFIEEGGVWKISRWNLSGPENLWTEFKPKDALGYNQRGAAKDAKGDRDGAYADYNRAIELDPKLAIAYYNRGFAKGNKGDLDGAIADYTKAIELDPKDADAYTNRGSAKHSNGDVKGAFADLKRALELDPEGAPYRTLGIPPKPSTSQKDAKSAELKFLELWAGDWTVEITVEVPGQPAPIRNKIKRKSDLLLQGLFLRSRDSITDAQTGEESQLTQILTYDPKRKTFRHWVLPENPKTLDSAGAWDESRSSFTMNWEVEGGLRLNHEGIMQNADTYVFTNKMTDGQGKVMWTAEGRIIRMK